MRRPTIWPKPLEELSDEELMLLLSDLAYAIFRERQRRADAQRRQHLELLRASGLTKTSAPRNSG
ncbi:hypothetical protein LGM81_05715 [Burkholderia multivorans]|nr:hypothetical protein [Burkholderia multivorans]